METQIRVGFDAAQVCLDRKGVIPSPHDGICSSEGPDLMESDMTERRGYNQGIDDDQPHTQLDTTRKTCFGPTNGGRGASCLSQTISHKNGKQSPGAVRAS